MWEPTEAGTSDVIQRFMTVVHEAQKQARGEPIDINLILRRFMETLSDGDRQLLARIEKAMLAQDARCRSPADDRAMLG